MHRTAIRVIAPATWKSGVQKEAFGGVVRSRIGLVTISATALLVLAFPAFAAPVDCVTTQTISGGGTVTVDYEQDGGSADCVQITTSNITVNFNGKTITCVNGPCSGDALVIAADNVTVTGLVVVGEWRGGVNNGKSGGVHYSTTLKNSVIDGPDYGLLGPGSLTKKNVFKDIQIGCIANVFEAMPTGALIEQNYCNSADYGLLIRGPASGTAATMKKNLIIATEEGASFFSGLIDVENIVIAEATTPVDNISATVAYVDNICEDTTDCDLPDAAFTFDMSW